MSCEDSSCYLLMNGSLDVYLLKQHTNALSFFIAKTKATFFRLYQTSEMKWQIRLECLIHFQIHELCQVHSYLSFDLHFSSKVFVFGQCFYSYLALYQPSRMFRDKYCLSAGVLIPIVLWLPTKLVLAIFPLRGFFISTIMKKGY